MELSAQRVSSVRKFLVVFILFLLFLAGLFFATRWFYSSNVLLDNKVARFQRSIVDNLLQTMYDKNYFQYKTLYQKQHPGCPDWRPARVIPDMELPEDWEGNKEFNTVYAKVNNWDPVNDLLGVSLYINNPSSLKLKVAKTKIIIPEFDILGRPIIDKNKLPDNTFVTKEALRNFVSHFPTSADFIDFVSVFASTADITRFISYNFSGLDPQVQTKLFGPYKWESAFCINDLLIVSFGKDIDIYSYKDDETVYPKLAIVIQAGCPTSYGDTSGVISSPPPVLPGIEFTQGWEEIYENYFIPPSEEVLIE